MPAASTPRVGVLAMQGAFRAHQQRLAELGASATLVRRPDELGDVDGLVIPGGESTTMSTLLVSSGLFDEVKARLSDGLPAFGTCAGLILLATEVLDGRDDQRSFGVLDVSVRRNAYGRQIDSFETDVAISGINGAASDEPFHAVFIRAPVIESIGPGVDVLAHLDGAPVCVAQGANMAAAFHPELSSDLRLHQRFLNQL